MNNKTAGSTQSTTGTGRSPLAAAFASVMGWAFDLFDLFILLYVAGPVGHQIFPVESETLSLALVFVSFAVSIVMRPGGAAIFGGFADKVGRKRIMVVVLAGVGLSTAAMGLVPSYAAAGMLAPILFLALRVVQGIFVGGVTAVTHTLGTESVPPRYRGMMSGLIGGGGAGLGAAMASVAFIIISAIFPGDAFTETGWRYMFFTGLLGAVLSLFVLRKVEESPVWLAAKAEKASGRQTTKPLSFKDLVTGRYGRITILNIAVAAGAGAQYYLTSGFLPTYLDVVTPVDEDVRGWVLLVASLIVVVAATGAGHLSERLGRRRTMLVIGAVNLVALPVILLVIARTDPGATVTIVLLCCLLATLANAAYAPVMIFLNERYPTEIRSRGTAVSWNTGFMLGGLLPTFVTLLSPTTEDIPSRLMIFVAGAVLVFIIAVVRSPETRGAIERG
ncbi:MFS transporter [Georgenia subflava]|uniref:MFS transporter n=1 Tax=Georgenia subflava TaxID=1622177 RepID=A0A6N7EEU7_9MICO|nr:MFS transporter [Georgenia subflava]MPV35488.1 MFS transporter [Georgenia subflava]